MHNIRQTMIALAIAAQTWLIAPCFGQEFYAFGLIAEVEKQKSEQLRIVRDDLNRRRL